MRHRRVLEVAPELGEDAGDLGDDAGPVVPDDGDGEQVHGAHPVDLGVTPVAA